jgi:hypothetical protein
MAPEMVKLMIDLKKTISTAGIWATNFTHRFMREKKNMARIISLTPGETCIFYLWC